FISETNFYINVCNIYGGGYVYSVLPDRVIHTCSKSCRPIVLKCAFSNESLKTLIKECVVFLSEYTRISYSIGFKVAYNKEKFNAYLFVLERTKDPDEKKIKLINFLIENNVHKLNEKCENADLIDFLESYNKDDLSKYNAKICFKKEINEENVNEDIKFRLDKNKIDSNDNG
ncbi:unnamed protein product, partial [Brachionus calyciflorus]